MPYARRAAAGLAVTWLTAVGFALASGGPLRLAQPADRWWVLVGTLGAALLVALAGVLVRGGAWIRAGVSVLGGVAVGLVWMSVAMALTGGHLLAGRYAYFWAWSVGGVAGLLAATLPLTRRGAAAGAGTVAAVAAATGWAAYRATRPPLALEIAVAPGATSADEQRIWSRVLGDPEPPPRTDVRTLPYVRQVWAMPSEGGRRIAVTLRPTTSAADSAELARRLAAAPQVAGVRWHRVAR